MKSTTITSGAVATTTCARLRVWGEQPATQRLADIAAAAQGTTLSALGSAKTGPFAPGAIAIATVNYMDVHPFRPGRPPV